MSKWLWIFQSTSWSHYCTSTHLILPSTALWYAVRECQWRILLQVYKNICDICLIHLILLSLLYLLAVLSFDVDWYILSLILNTISFLPLRLKCKPCRFLQLCICRGSSNVREVARHDGSIIFLSFRFTEAILLLSLKLSGKVAQPLRQRNVLFLS